jgi:hypothetical protein
MAVFAGALALGCRSDAGGGERANVNGASSSSVSPLASGAAELSPRSASPVASPSASALPANAGCGGPPTEAPLPRAEERTLAASREGHYRFDLKYPLLRIDDEKRAEKLNQALSEQLRAVEKRFVREASGDPGKSLTRDDDGEPDPENARWFEGKCAIAYLSSAFVSVACDTMEGPGAHPNLDKFAYNFQICPEVRLVTLGDLCRALPSCKKKIVDLINEDFRTGQKKETGIQFRVGPRGAPGQPPDIEHPVATLEAFGITPAGLRIYLFDELPHVLQAFGVVDLPAAKVRPVLHEDLAARLWQR